MATTTTTTTATKMLDTAISDLECRLGLKPGQQTQTTSGGNNSNMPNQKNKKEKKPKKAAVAKKKPASGPSPEELAAQPEICKLEFKVGVITKVWEHPNADKLYCEEIDVGEESGPRQIASGLRPHFTLEEMMGQRLLVVANLKAKNLVKFKSHGMVLCCAAAVAAETTVTTKEDGSVVTTVVTEKVEFIEPPPSAKVGDVVTFEGLPAPMYLSASQIEKKKVFLKCLEGLKTDADGVATWNGHKFMVGSEFCKSKTICNGQMR